MSEKQHYPLIILGSGPAGWTAVHGASKLKPVVVLVSNKADNITTTDVDNWPGDDQGVQGQT